MATKHFQSTALVYHIVWQYKSNTMPKLSRSSNGIFFTKLKFYQCLGKIKKHANMPKVQTSTEIDGFQF